MDFSWALLRLKEGRRVRRSIWGDLRDISEECAYVELVHDLPGFDPMTVAVKNSGGRTPYRLNDQQLLAEDWELTD